MLLLKQAKKLDERKDEAEDDLAQATSSPQVESTCSENTVFWLKACDPEVYEELALCASSPPRLILL